MAREKIWTRIHLTPMLQAEADRDDVRRYFAAQAREKELMKDVEGWKGGSVYNSDRYVFLVGERGWERRKKRETNKRRRKLGQDREFGNMELGIWDMGYHC